MNLELLVGAATLVVVGVVGLSWIASRHHGMTFRDGAAIVVLAFLLIAGYSIWEHLGA